MTKKILMSLFLVALKSHLFASTPVGLSTPVGQANAFPPVAPTNQKVLHRQYKHDTRPVRNSLEPAPILILGFAKQGNAQDSTSLGVSKSGGTNLGISKSDDSKSKKTSKN